MIGILLSLIGGAVLLGRAVVSRTKCADVVNSISENPEYSGSAMSLSSGAIVSIRNLSAADRRSIQSELLDQYQRIESEVKNKTALDLYGFEMFLAEARAGNPYYTREWLKKTHWDVFNTLLVEIVLTKGMNPCNPLRGVHVLLSLAWDPDTATRDYPRFVLHRAFFDVVKSDPAKTTLDDASVFALEERLFDEAAQWVLDPTYTDRWEQSSLEGKPPGGLFKNHSK